MECAHCSGTEFKKISENTYKCTYCGSLMFVNKDERQPAAGLSVPSRLNRNAAKVIIAAAALIILGISAGLLLTFESVNKEDISPVRTTREMSKFGPDAVEKEGPLKAEFSGVSEVPDSIGNVYIIGMYKNVGKAVIGKPMVTAVLYSQTHHKVAAGRGYGIRDFLLPGEETPVKVLISHAPPYSTFEVVLKPEKPFLYSNLKRPKIIFQNVKLTKGHYSGHDVRGEVRNGSGRDVRYLNIITLLYDRDDQIVGSGTAYIAEDVLHGGDYSPFSINISSVKGTPVSFKLDYNCSFVKE